jgi:hypothetical protein
LLTGLNVCTVRRYAALDVAGTGSRDARALDSVRWRARRIGGGGVTDQLSSDLASLRIRRDEPPGESGGRKIAVRLVLLASSPIRS